MALALPEFVQLVRKFCRDFPKANELRGVAESTDTEIAMCVMLALDDYNMTPPPIRQVSLETHPSTHLLLLGTLTQLFLSAGILQMRNQLSYSDGGVAVNVWDKGPMYVGNATMFANLYEQKKIALKRSINISNGFGIVQSAEFNLYNFTAFFGGDYVTTSSSGTLLGGGLAIPGPYPNYQGNVLIPVVVKASSAVTQFTVADWKASSTTPDIWEFIFVHNLGVAVPEVLILDSNNNDVTSSLNTQYVSNNHVIIRVTSIANIFNGSIQAFVR